MQNETHKIFKTHVPQKNSSEDPVRMVYQTPEALSSPVTHCNEHLPIKLERKRGSLYETLKPPATSGQVTEGRRGGEAGILLFRVCFYFFFSFLWGCFLFCFVFIFALVFICLLAVFVLLSFMGECNRGGIWGNLEVNRIGVHDVKPSKI